ncbi:major facilitator superfamily domain-containing protein [Elsinoe ampelina]|uniref:Major facilitator superfamily domain-containing protein n=1 Tax=Elsinoe ampelina TaxID=302913 RepID=A0A6A6GBS5_9PEZI|nr:major facilitator superfamily domain-containing protein [Elsinoe ampelina]
MYKKNDPPDSGEAPRPGSVPGLGSGDVHEPITRARPRASISSKDDIAIDDSRSTSDDTSQPPPNHAPDIPPNGGYGWLCTLCVALINAHTWGINSSYGVFLSHYLTTNLYPSSSPLQFAFVGSLSISCALLLSPLATITTREYGTRTTLLIGTALEAGSLIAASFASEMWHLFLTQGVCFGLGMGFLFVGSVGIVPQWFTTRRSLANGIATAGSGFGGLLYSLASGAMIRNLGLPWTFRILGIVALVVNTGCSLVVRDRNKQIGASQLAFDWSLFRRVEYLLLLGFGWFSMLGYVVLLFSLASYARAVGLSASQASVVSAILNLGQGLGRPPIGYFSDAVGRINMACFATFMAGLLALVVWIFATSFGVLIFYALVGGAVAGTFWTVIAPVTVEVVGLKDVPSALSITWVVLAVPCTFSEPIGLEIVSFERGRYLGAQVLVGFMYLAGAGCCVLLRGWKIGEVRAVEEMKGEGVEVVGTEEAGDDTLTQAKRRARRRMWVDCVKWKKV